MNRAAQVWPRISVEVPSASAQLVEAALLAAGSLGNIIEDDQTRAVPEQAYRRTGKSKIIATFDDFADIQELVEGTLGEYFGSLSDPPNFSLAWDELVEEDWDAKFKASWKSVDLGCGVYIVPSWERENFVAPEDTKSIIYLDPGMAFGTGHHETTKLCAKSLVTAFTQNSFLQKDNKIKVLDVGTGTAILAILSAHLGAQEVIGTEICEEAVVVATENIAANMLSEKISVYLQEPDHFGQIFDLVVANILAQPLIKLAPQIQAALKSSGMLVLSGVLSTQAAEVQQAYEDLDMQHQETLHDGEWVALIFKATDFKA